MDPDACLANLRDAVNTDNWEEAATFAIQLDTWLSSGGFMPKEWADARG
jgi:hypothetical protein